MSGKRQNNQWLLAFEASGRGEAPESASEGTEPQAATRATESPANTEQLMEEICRRENLIEALRHVQANKWSPGSIAFPNAFFDSHGLPRLAARMRAQPDRTAVYGPVRTVVWEG